MITTWGLNLNSILIIKVHMEFFFNSKSYNTYQERDQEQTRSQILQMETGPMRRQRLSIRFAEACDFS